MRRLLLLVVAVVLAGCGSSTKPAAETSTTATVETANCSKGSLHLLTAGKITAGTDNPAFPPWFGGGTPKGSPWKINDPSTGKGFDRLE